MGAVPIQVSKIFNSIVIFDCCNSLKNANVNKINYQDISIQTDKNRTFQKNANAKDTLLTKNPFEVIP